MPKKLCIAMEVQMKTYSKKTKMYEYSCFGNISLEVATYLYSIAISVFFSK